MEKCIGKRMRTADMIASKKDTSGGTWIWEKAVSDGAQSHLRDGGGRRQPLKNDCMIQRPGDYSGQIRIRHCRAWPDPTMGTTGQMGPSPTDGWLGSYDSLRIA